MQNNWFVWCVYEPKPSATYGRFLGTLYNYGIGNLAYGFIYIYRGIDYLVSIHMRKIYFNIRLVFILVSSVHVGYIMCVLLHDMSVLFGAVGGYVNVILGYLCYVGQESMHAWCVYVVSSRPHIEKLLWMLCVFRNVYLFYIFDAVKKSD